MALGSQARATKSRSGFERPKPATASDVAQTRTAPLAAMSATARPAVRPWTAPRSTATPSRAKSSGWASAFHSFPRTAPTAPAPPPHAAAARAASASVARALAPEKPARFSEKVASRDTTTSAAARSVGSGRNSSRLSANRKTPAPATATATPSASSRGARRASAQSASGSTPPFAAPVTAKLRDTPKPASAKTSSSAADATTSVGMPVVVP